MYDCIIIGGGLAGLTAAIYASRAGLSAVVIEKGECGGQAVLADYVENYPGFTGSGFDLADKTREQAENAGAKIIYTDVESVDLSADIKKVCTTDGDFDAKTVILASGASHKHAGFKGEEEFTGRGVSYCATCDGAFFEDGTVAVIGGANTAVSEALYLSDICKKVYLIYRKDKLRAEATLVERVQQKDNIEVLYNTVPIEVKGSKKVESLVTDKSEIALDGVFVAVGFSPQTSFLGDDVKKADDGCIITDENMHTNLTGVFAAGDCRVKSLRQMISAASDGAIAANEVVKYIKQRG